MFLGKKTYMTKVTKIVENVTCIAKGLKTRKMQTCVQVVKVEMKRVEYLSSKKKIKMAEALKMQESLAEALQVEAEIILFH